MKSIRTRCCWISRLGAVLAVALALVVTLAPAVALAATQLTHGFLRYELEDKSITIVDYAGDEEEVFVPAYIAGNPVNRIAMGAFYDSWTVKKVYLPDTVTDVDEGAFAEDQEVIFKWNAGRGYDGGQGTDSGDKEDSGKKDEDPSKDSGTKDEGKESGSVTNDTGRGTLWPNGALIGAPGTAAPGYGVVYGNPVYGDRYAPNVTGTAGTSGSQGGPAAPASPTSPTPGAASGSSTFSSSSVAAPDASPAAGTVAVDTNTVRNAGTPATGVVTTAAGTTRTPATGDPTSYALPVALIAVGSVVIGVALVRMRRS